VQLAADCRFAAAHDADEYDILRLSVGVVHHCGITGIPSHGNPKIDMTGK
jgi:hypothetical protein